MSFAQSLAKTLGSVPYDPSYIEETKWRRTKLSSSSGLGIDRLLSYCNISDPQTVYPPKSREAFSNLVEKVDSVTSASIRRLRIYQTRALLYLFLDFSQNTPAGQESVAEHYASELWLSNTEQALVRGLWLLDHGRSEEALEPLGEPWEAEGQDLIHEYIIESLSDQRPRAVASYLAARGQPGEHTDELVKSYTSRGKFAEVLELAREQQNTQYLMLLARSSIGDKRKSLELAQLPCTPEEWQIIEDELNQIIVTSSPSITEENATATATMARNIMLVRALHVGDTLTVLKLKNTNEQTKLLCKGLADI